MKVPHRSYLRLLTLAVVLAAVGCQDRVSDKASVSGVTSPRQTSPLKTQHSETDVDASDKRVAVAAKAKDVLFAKLSGRLMEVMQSRGPVAAIDVCSKEASTIAEAVGRDHGVAIGRTSFRLRNPANAPRNWVKPFVEKHSDTPQHVLLDDGSLGALFPIHLKVKCLMCHGQPDDILDTVKPELAKRYPDDKATGFKLDDLRGWFWVEVPTNAEETSKAGSDTATDDTRKALEI